MAMGLLGKKIGMTQVFDASGNLVPVTLIEAGPCYVVQVKTREKDGYTAVQVGFDSKPERKAIKPELGHFKKAKVEPKRLVREFRVMEGELDNFAPGQEITECFSFGNQLDTSHNGVAIAKAEINPTGVLCC